MTKRTRPRRDGCRVGLSCFVMVLVVGAHVRARADIIIKQGNSRATAEIVNALLKEAPRDRVPRVVDLTGDFGTDFARTSRAAGDDGETLFAVGPNATVLAGAVAEARKKGRVVALAVPNPERLKATATYVAFYPPLSSVFELLQSRFGARSLGLVYSPNQNDAVAAAFAAAAHSRGLKVVALPVSSPGELARRLKQALAGIDVLLVPADPLLFDRDGARILVDEARAAGKPAVGFLAELPQIGFTGSLMTSREALARAAWLATRRPAKEEASGVIEVPGPLLWIDGQGATVVGPRGEAR